METSNVKNNFKSVISLVDKLRDISLEEYIKLPKIVAVGSQSSGKSSLIEQVVGLDFLPRGSGVVTRRPLQIRMIFQQGLAQSYACFQQIPNVKFTDFSKVKSAIQQVTDKVCGKDKNIVDKAIVLYIYSANVPNLTMIDLPGLTRISIGGQSQNIHEITKNMINKYMQEENTIILCVIPANQDITNDQVLHMARQIDVKGERTIGCITKIDIMDRGTDARELLMNKGQVPLRLGYVGIKNRSQADINQNKTVKQSLQQQKLYFSKSPIYSSLSPKCLGTSSLVEIMTKVLESCIVNYLPVLLEKIRQKKSALSQIIKKYGKPLPKSISQKHTLIWQICNQYILNYRNSIKGIPSTLKSNQRIQKVSYHIQQILKDFLLEESNQNFKQYLTQEKIAFALKKFDTINQLGIPSLDSYLYLLNPLLNDLRLPMESALANLCEQITHLSDLIIEDVSFQYRQFRQYLTSKTNHIIIEFRKKSNQFLQNVLECEVKGVTYQKLDLARQVDHTKLTQLQRKFPLVPILRQSIMKYYQRCVRNLRQLIPKNFYYLLINEATKKIEFQVFQSCAQSEQKVQKWLQLSGYSVQERIKNQKQYEVIGKAQQYILTYGGFSKAVSIKKNKKRQQRQKQMEQLMIKQKQKKKLKQEKPHEIKKQNLISEFLKKDSGKTQGTTTTKIQHNPPKGGTMPPKQPENVMKKQVFQQPIKKQQPSNSQSQKFDFLGFNTKKQQKPVIIQKPVQKQPEKPVVVPQNKAGVFAQLFGMSGQKKKQEKVQVDKNQASKNSARKPIFPNQTQQKNQTINQKYNNEMGKATDKGVDQIFKNEKFQQQSKKAVEKGTAAGFQKQFNTSEETAGLFGKGAAWVWGQQKTQNIVKDQAKKQARDKTQM